MKLPQNLAAKLQTRKQNNAVRQLPSNNNLVDFASNDYIGLSKSKAVFDATHRFLTDNKIQQNGATGSRLLSGNHDLYAITEQFIAQFHQSESALIFNSGYDANVGFFGCVPQKNDFILYDELCHASIRDGILMGYARSYKFKHNDGADVERLIALCQEKTNEKNNLSEIYIVTESVFSMDGDTPNLTELVAISEKYNCLLVIDEAHALGVFSKNGAGLMQELNLASAVFARIVTFGK